MQRFYFGWFVVAAAMLIFALVTGTTFSAFGFFVLPVSKEFELSRADINTGLIILSLGNAVLAPFIGRLLDRQPARLIMMTSSVLLGGSLIALGLSHSLMLNVAIIAVPAAIGVLGAGMISTSVMIARWFTVYRGRAMALAGLGLSLGAIVVAPTVGWLIDTEGWRTALMITGGVVAVAMTAVVAALREKPGPDDIESRDPAATQEAPDDPAGAEEASVPSAFTILRMPLFWALAIGVGLGSGVNQALIVSLVPLALESGLNTMQSASLVSVTGISGIASMLLLAVVADKFDRTIMLALLLVGVTLPCGMLLVAESYAILLVTALIIGLALAVVTPLYLALVADRFGLAAFGTARGLFVPVLSLFGAALIRFIGEVFDRTESYDLGLWTFIAADLVAAGLVLSSRYIPGAAGSRT